MYYLKAHSADPPPCQGVLQSGWPDDVLSHGSAMGPTFLSGPVLESCAQLWSAHRLIAGAVSKECAHFLCANQLELCQNICKQSLGRHITNRIW